MILSSWIHGQLTSDLAISGPTPSGRAPGAAAQATAARQKSTVTLRSAENGVM